MSFEYRWNLSGDRRNLVIHHETKVASFALDFKKNAVDGEASHVVVSRRDVWDTGSYVLGASAAVDKVAAITAARQVVILEYGATEATTVAKAAPFCRKVSLSHNGRYLSYIGARAWLEVQDLQDDELGRQYVFLPKATVDHVSFTRRSELAVMESTGDRWLFSIGDDGCWRNMRDEVEYCHHLDTIGKTSGVFATENELDFADVVGWGDGRIYLTFGVAYDDGSAGHETHVEEEQKAKELHTLVDAEGKLEAPYTVHKDSNGITYGVHPPVFKSYGSDAREEEEPDYHIWQIYRLPPKGKEERAEEIHESPAGRKAYNKIMKGMLKLSLSELDLLRLKIEAQIREERILIVRAHVAKERITEKDIVEQMRGLEHYLRMRDVVSADEALDDLEHDLGLSVD